jgi:hypothetical protein
VSRMSNNRLSDDGIFTSAGADRPAPQFVPSLINRLGLSRASQEEKDRGIEEWLRENTPSERLKRSLISSGYSRLLHLPA